MLYLVVLTDIMNYNNFLQLVWRMWLKVQRRWR